jgi:hypothetical protein
MEQVRVNLTLERKIWEKFSTLVPKRKKSAIVSELLKQEVERAIRQNEEEALTLAFQQASRDKKRLAAICEWGALDVEGWD